MISAICGTGIGLAVLLRQAGALRALLPMTRQVYKGVTLSAANQIYQTDVRASSFSNAPAHQRDTL